MPICAMITRTATEEVKILATQFKAVAIVGPGQSDKTTLFSKIYLLIESTECGNYALGHEVT